MIYHHIYIYIYIRKCCLPTGEAEERSEVKAEQVGEAAQAES